MHGFIMENTMNMDDPLGSDLFPSTLCVVKMGGFLKWRYPNSWMVYKGKSY